MISSDWPCRDEAVWMCVDGSLRARRVVKRFQRPGCPERLYIGPVLSPRLVSDNLFQSGFLDLSSLCSPISPRWTSRVDFMQTVWSQLRLYRLGSELIGGAAQMFLASYSGSGRVLHLYNRFTIPAIIRSAAVTLDSQSVHPVSVQGQNQTGFWVYFCLFLAQTSSCRDNSNRAWKHLFCFLFFLLPGLHSCYPKSLMACVVLWSGLIDTNLHP